MWFSVSLCMDDCNFTSGGTYFMGKLVDFDIRSRHNWSGCYNGWSCSCFGILFDYALVENTMAKLKYVLPFISYPQAFVSGAWLHLYFLQLTVQCPVFLYKIDVEPI